MPLTAEVTPLEENKVRLDVAVPEDEVQKGMARAIRQLGREVRVPGFRPGKAPAEVIVQRVGRDAVVQEMLKGSLGGWYSAAVAETGVQPIDDPDLDLESVPEEGDLTFQATVQVRPTATLGEYTGLDVGRAEVEVPEGALEAELNAAAREGLAPGAGRARVGRRRLRGDRLRRRDRRQAAAPGGAARLRGGAGRRSPAARVRRAAHRAERGGDRLLPAHVRRERRPPRAGRQDGRLHGHRQAGAGEAAARAERRPGRSR